MFATQSTRRLAQKAPRPRASRLMGFENLETRQLLATTYVIMDFTPDSHTGNLMDTFSNVRVPGKTYAPNFLDFDGDRKITSNDAVLCAQRVASKTASFFSFAASGLDVRFYYGDITTSTNWGTQWINYGKAYSNVETAVMYFGGTNRQSGAIGMAPVASNGYNFEGYGECYTRAIGNWMASYRTTASTSEFVDRIAQVTAHELGHMFGLQHSSADMQNNVMNASQPSNAGAATFLNQSVKTPAGMQNAYQELRNSFYNQAQQSGQPALGGQACLPQATLSAVNAAATANLADNDNLASNLASRDQVFATLLADNGPVSVPSDVVALRQARRADAAEIHAADQVLANPALQLAARASTPAQALRSVLDQKLFPTASELGRAEDQIFAQLGADLLAAHLPTLV